MKKRLLLPCMGITITSVMENISVSFHVLYMQDRGIGGISDSLIFLIILTQKQLVL